MAFTLACGCECGTTGSGSHWPNAVGTQSFSTTTFRSGLSARRFNPTAGKSYSDIQTRGWTLSTRHYISHFYIRFATLPDGDTWFFSGNNINRGIGVAYKSSDTKIYPGTSTSIGGAITFGSTGATVTTGVWYRVDCYINTSANPWTCDVQVDGSALTQLTAAQAAADMGTIMIGGVNNLSADRTADVFIDDIVESQTAGDYPIGVHYIKGYIPNEDGTHVSVDAFSNLAGTGDFTDPTTDAYTHIDKRPITTGDTAIQQEDDLGTAKIQVGFEPHAESAAPIAVEVICGIHADGTGANTPIYRVNDGGTTDNVFSGTVGSSAVIYKRKYYATKPSSGAWTTAAFDALLFEFGLATDTNPDPYIDAVMLEAVFEEVAAGDAVPRAWQSYRARRVA